MAEEDAEPLQQRDLDEQEPESDAGEVREERDAAPVHDLAAAPTDQQREHDADRRKCRAPSPRASPSTSTGRVT